MVNSCLHTHYITSAYNNTLPYRTSCALRCANYRDFRCYMSIPSSDAGRIAFQTDKAVLSDYRLRVKQLVM